MAEKRKIVIAPKISDHLDTELVNMQISYELAQEADIIISQDSLGDKQVVKVRGTNPDDYEVIDLT